MLEPFWKMGLRPRLSHYHTGQCAILIMKRERVGPGSAAAESLSTCTFHFSLHTRVLNSQCRRSLTCKCHWLNFRSPFGWAKVNHLHHSRFLRSIPLNAQSLNERMSGMSNLLVVLVAMQRVLPIRRGFDSFSSVFDCCLMYSVKHSRARF